MDQKINVWGCFSTRGFGQIYLFKENLTATNLCTIYEDVLLPSAKHLFGDDGTSILQEDNHPVHRSKAAQTFREEHAIRRMEWPPYSPDLNPIENMWSVLKRNVRRRNCTTISSFSRTIEVEWRKFSRCFSSRLVDSMKVRVQTLIDVKGDHLLYYLI
jgi:hypothetical protein